MPKCDWIIEDGDRIVGEKKTVREAKRYAAAYADAFHRRAAVRYIGKNAGEGQAFFVEPAGNS